MKYDVKTQKIVYSILSIIVSGLGIYLMFRPEQSLSKICHIIGMVLVLYGIVKMLGYFTKDMYQLAFQFDLGIGIFSIIIGMMLVFHTKYLLSLFTTFIGLLILLDGLFKIQISIDARRFGLSKWWLILALAVVTILAGFVLVIRPISATEFLIRLIGINLLLDGGLNLWVVLYTFKGIKFFKEANL